tara:strand:+ start:74 stop:373 length:300 start_codon:yes stop_codon:yes gene_type:complete
MTYTHRIKNGIRIDLTADEITALEDRDTQWNNGALDRALNELRRKRNNLLKETDWMANSDVTMSSDMTTYRQALRDLTSGLDTVAKINEKEFPTKPSGV